MAKIQNPIIGRSSGQAGGMVFGTVYGQNVMRAKPASYNDAKSEKQVKQRHKMAFLAAVVASIKASLLLILIAKPATMSAYSFLIKLLSPWFMSDGVNIATSDPNGVILNGNIAGQCVSHCGYDVDHFNLSAVPANWDENLSNAAKVRVVVINLTKKSAYFKETTTVALDGGIDIGIPAGWANGDSLSTITFASPSGTFEDYSSLFIAEC